MFNEGEDTDVSSRKGTLHPVYCPPSVASPPHPGLRAFLRALDLRAKGPATHKEQMWVQCLSLGLRLEAVFLGSTGGSGSYGSGTATAMPTAHGTFSQNHGYGTVCTSILTLRGLLCCTSVSRGLQCGFLCLCDSAPRAQMTVTQNTACRHCRQSCFPNV